MIGFVHGEDFSVGLHRAVRPLAVKGLKLAGAALAAEIRRRVSTPGPPRSAPGKAPRMDTGELAGSIFWEVDEVNLRVYVVADTAYAYYLEFGTSDMAPRPFMRQGLAGFAAGQASRWVSVAFAAPRTPVDESLMRR